MIDESIIKAVIEQTDIVRLIGEYVQLKKRGRRLVGLCPFHHEKTASFYVTPERGLFKCFGCGVGGSAASFLMQIERLSFPEAIERLADRLGITIKRVDGPGPASTRYREAKSLVGVMQVAQAYFLASILGPEGVMCREYARGRGISDAMVSSFGLGYAPDSWDGIVGALSSSGASLSDAEKLGLVGKNDRGYYARFRERLMFPVHSLQGEIIAFGGRYLRSGDVAKYINSPESDIYTKGEHLYGLYQAKSHILREKSAVLVEGNVDAVMMHGYGFCHTVASMGTALTPKQAELLFRQTRRLFLMYDGDAAGQKAMSRALGVLLKQDFEAILAVELPKGDDPDSFLRAYGKEGMQTLLEGAQPLARWCVERACESILALPIELRKARYSELGELLMQFTNPRVRRHYLEESARLLGLDIISTEEMLHLKGLEDGPREAVAVAHGGGIEYEVTRLLLRSTERYEAFMQCQGLDLVRDPALRSLLLCYAGVENKSSTYEVMSHLDEGQSNLYEQLVCSDFEIDDSEIERWYEGAMAALTNRWASQEIQRLGQELEASLKKNDAERVQQIMGMHTKLIELMQKGQMARKFVWGSEQS